MTKHSNSRDSEPEAMRKREKIQNHFWKQVGADEHISLPMLKDAVKRELNCEDDRRVQSQIKLMQTEGRIRIESRVKVWIKQPRSNLA
jgi:hypothetical protein